jgi:hypothetical protein
LDSLLWVVNASLFQHLGKDGDGRVDWVGDDQDEGLGAGVGNCLGKSGTDSSVDLEKVSMWLGPYAQCDSLSVDDKG